MAKRWTEAEIDFLKEWYPTEGAKLCAEVLDRTVSSIKHKAEKEKIKSLNSKLKTDVQYKKELPDNYINIENYSGSGEKILHKHVVCGHEWNARPADILSGYRLCPKCGGTSKTTEEEYSSRIKDTEYINLTPYINNSTKILHKHKTCGYEWLVRPKNILRGEGCPACAHSNSKFIYFIHFNEFNIYKIGITNNINIRLSSFGSKPNVLKIKELNSGKDALKLEQKILNKFKEYKYNSGLLKSGNTETLLDPPVDSILNMLK